jgi:type II secretory pathway component PulL
MAATATVAVVAVDSDSARRWLEVAGSGSAEAVTAEAVVAVDSDSARRWLEVAGSDSAEMVTAEMVTAEAVTVQLPEAAETVDSAQRSAAEAAIEPHTRRQS